MGRTGGKDPDRWRGGKGESERHGQHDHGRSREREREEPRRRSSGERGHYSRHDGGSSKSSRRNPQYQHARADHRTHPDSSPHAAPSLGRSADERIRILQTIQTLRPDQKEAIRAAFFRSDDYLSVTQDANDLSAFFDFSSRYTKMQLLRLNRALDRPHQPPPPLRRRLNLPPEYSDRYRIPFAIMTQPRPPGPQMRSSGLDARHLSELRVAMHMYEDFNQKKRFNALRKMATDKGNLPIASFAEQIVRLLSEHQVLLVAGDTGCGKSTQVPQYLLNAGYRCIACTQPRRLSCISLCRRVAYETLDEFGQAVRYSVRFDTTRTQNTRLLFLTEGLLLRQMQNDPELVQYDVVVIDEVHERHLTTDLLLGMLRQLLRRNRDIRIVLMSATINLDLFQKFFDQTSEGGKTCPVIKVPVLRWFQDWADDRRVVEKYEEGTDRPWGGGKFISTEEYEQQQEDRTQTEMAKLFATPEGKAWLTKNVHRIRVAPPNFDDC